VVGSGVTDRRTTDWRKPAFVVVALIMLTR